MARGISKTNPSFVSGNIQSVVITNATTSVTHGLGRIPTGYIVTKLKSPSGFIVSDEAVSSWTASTAYLVSNKANTSADIIWV